MMHRFQRWFHIPSVAKILFLLLLFPLGAVYMYWDDNGNRTVGEAVLIFVVVAGFPVIIALLIFMGHYTVIRKLIRDRSDTSVLPLFDEGSITYPTSILASMKSACIDGIIAGLPVVVEPVDISSDDEPPKVRFTFRPLYRHDRNGSFDEYIEFEINRITSRLRHDVKPEVLQFVEDLKEKGYYYDFPDE